MALWFCESTPQVSDSAFRRTVLRLTRAPWRRLRNTVVHALILLALTAYCVVASQLIWSRMAGDRILLGQQPSAATTPASVGPPAAEIEPPVVKPDLPPQSPAPVSPPARSGPAAVDGTTVAAGLILVVNLSAILIAWAALRSHRRRKDSSSRGAEPDLGAEEDEASPCALTESDMCIDPDTSSCASADVVASPAAGEARAPQECSSTSTTSTGEAPDEAVSPAQSSVGDTKVMLFDSRLNKRVAHEAPTRLQWNGHDVGGTSVNLSMSGVCCRVDGLVPAQLPHAGTLVRITMSLAGTWAIFDARVTWHRDEGDFALLGMHFGRLENSQEIALASVIVGGTAV